MPTLLATSACPRPVDSRSCLRIRPYMTIRACTSLANQAITDEFVAKLEMARIVNALHQYTPDPVGRDRRTRVGCHLGIPRVRSANRFHPQTDLRKGWTRWQSPLS